MTWNIFYRCVRVLICLVILGLGISAEPLHAYAERGVLDLASASWQEPIRLDGEWLYVPGIFANEKDIEANLLSSTSGLAVKIPGSVRSLRDATGQPLGDETWGTLLLEIRNMKPPFDNVGLQLRGDTAYEVFALDLERPGPMRSLIKVGRPSSQKATSIPQIASPLGLWNVAGSGHYLLLIHLSGFHYTDTNLWTSPRLGSYERLRHDLDRVFLLDAAVAGAVLVMSLYYLSLFFHRREDKAALLLGTWSTAVFLRHLGCSPSLQQVLFPESSPLLFSMFRSFEFGLLGIMGGAAAWFAVESFGLEKLRRLARIETAVGVIMLLFCTLVPSDIYPRYILPINAILFFQVSTYLYATASAMKSRVPGSLYLTLGGGITAATVFYDMSIGLGYLNSSLFLTPIGMTLLVFANGQVVSKLFARAFRTAQRLSVSLQEEVEQKTRRIRSMLDNIPQGVVNLLPPGVAEPEYSRHLENLLGTKLIAGHSIQTLLLDLSPLNSDEKDRIMSTLQASIGEDRLNFELNESQLPLEMEFRKEGVQKHFQVSWVPIVNNQAVTESIQITLNDITQLRAMEQESEDQKQELSYIQEILRLKPENFRIFVDSSTLLLMENLRLIQCNSQGLSEISKILFINMHTIKGSARTLGLKRLSMLVHEVEQSYVLLLSNVRDGWNQSQLLEQIETVRRSLEHYQYIFQSVLGHQMNREADVSVSRQFLEQHCQLLSKLSSSINQSALHSKLLDSLHILESEVFQDASEFFQDFVESAERIARDLGKDHPLLLVEADGFMLSHEAEIALSHAIIHLLRNALDHGIEPARERLEKGKAPFGCISIRLDDSDGSLCITMEDDGRGLALQTLQAKAAHLGLGPLENSQAVAELIFHAGLSTAQSISEISGRGMGMDAVRKFVRDVGGDVQIQLQDGQSMTDFAPFHLLILLPASVYRRKKSTPVQLAVG